MTFVDLEEGLEQELISFCVSFTTTVVLFVLKYTIVDYWDKKTDLRNYLILYIETWSFPVISCKKKDDRSSADAMMQLLNESRRELALCRQKIQVLKRKTLSCCKLKLLCKLEAYCTNLARLILTKEEDHDEIATAHRKIRCLAKKL